MSSGKWRPSCLCLYVLMEVTPQYRRVLVSLQGFIPGVFGVSHGALQFMAYEELKKSYNKHRGLPPDAKFVSTQLLADRYQATWWRHQMETFSALLALCGGNSPVTGGFPPQRPVTQSFDIFIDLRLKKWLSTQSRRWWFETPTCSLWRHCNASQGSMLIHC